MWPDGRVFFCSWASTELVPPSATTPQCFFCSTGKTSKRGGSHASLSLHGWPAGGPSETPEARRASLLPCPSELDSTCIWRLWPWCVLWLGCCDGSWVCRRRCPRAAHVHGHACFFSHTLSRLCGASHGGQQTTPGRRSFHTASRAYVRRS